MLKLIWEGTIDFVHIVRSRVMWRNKCYKLVWYPQSFKFNKPKKGYNNGQVNASIIEDANDGNNMHGGMTSQVTSVRNWSKCCTLFMQEI